MCSNLIEQKILLGKTRNEVTEMLGQPDETNGNFIKYNVDFGTVFERRIQKNYLIVFLIIKQTKFRWSAQPIEYSSLTEMSEKDLIEYIESNLENSPMIDTETGISALKELAKIADRENVEWALAGGIAMHLYGSPRLTKDVDVISLKRLPIAATRSIGFGGESYEVTVGKKKIHVDWIVREDSYRQYYVQALKDANELKNGLKIITPEWLAILKYIAGRDKDTNDIVFLLRKNGYLKREKIRENIVKIKSEDVWFAMLPNWQRLFDLADGKIAERDKYYRDPLR